MLKLNQEKTELININTKHKSSRMTGDIQVQVNENIVCAAELVRNLGVNFDSSLTMEKQVNASFKACYYHIIIYR